MSWKIRDCAADFTGSSPRDVYSSGCREFGEKFRIGEDWRELFWEAEPAGCKLKNFRCYHAEEEGLTAAADRDLSRVRLI